MAENIENASSKEQYQNEKGPDEHWKTRPLLINSKIGERGLESTSVSSLSDAQQGSRRNSCVGSPSQPGIFQMLVQSTSFDAPHISSGNKTLTEMVKEKTNFEK